MRKRWLLLVVGVFVLLQLSGCATAQKQDQMQAQALKNQISVLEAQVQAKDQEINGLKESLDKVSQDKEEYVKAQAETAAHQKVIGSVKSRPKPRHIQIALKNAGYDPGSVDGHLGKKTRDAIKDFQKANKLPVDGKVGKETWELLREYLYKKAK